MFNGTQGLLSASIRQSSPQYSVVISTHKTVRDKIPSPQGLPSLFLTLHRVFNLFLKRLWFDSHGDFEAIFFTITSKTTSGVFTDLWIPGYESPKKNVWKILFWWSVSGTTHSSVRWCLFKCSDSKFSTNRNTSMDLWLQNYTVRGYKRRKF
jgi:hypothetical protein